MYNIIQFKEQNITIYYSIGEFNFFQLIYFDGGGAGRISLRNTYFSYSGRWDLCTAVSLSKTHKFHSTIVIRYCARPRFRDTWLPVSAGDEWSIVAIASSSFSRFLWTRARYSRSTLLHIRLSAHITLPLLAAPFVFLVVVYAFFFSARAN